jgi:hypothetical protein
MVIADFTGAWKSSAPSLGACAGTLVGFLVALAISRH